MAREAPPYCGSGHAYVCPSDYLGYAELAATSRVRVEVSTKNRSKEEQPPMIFTLAIHEGMPQGMIGITADDMSVFELKSLSVFSKDFVKEVVVVKFIE